MREEFGFEATPLPLAMREYLAWLKAEAAAEATPPVNPPLSASLPLSVASPSPSSTSPPPQEGSLPAGHQGRAVQGGCAGLVVAVTGGASGIGRGIVLAAAARGCRVVCLDTRQSPLEGGVPAAEEHAAAGSGGEVLFVRGDVTERADVAGAVAMAVRRWPRRCLLVAPGRYLTASERDRIANRWGRLDVFINNAALDLTDPPHSLPQQLTSTTLEQWERVHRVNTLGYFLGAQVAVEQFLRQEPRAQTGLRGKLINITSQHGMVACPGNLAYGTSKAAAVYMTKQIAVDYAEQLIACNGVAPGKIVKEAARPVSQYSYDRTPCKRLGTPADVASAVCWLASDEAGSYQTGHNLMVDGGWMAF